MPRSPRQERIHRRLRLLGEGPAAFYRDACNIADSTVSLETGGHLLAHAVREIESAVRQVLLPADYAPPLKCGECRNRPGAHRAQVEAILKAYDFAPDDTVFVSWMRLCDSDDLSPHRLAHRSSLGDPRDTGTATTELWAVTESFLYLLLDRFEARFGDHLPFLADLLQKPGPGRGDVSDLLSRVPNNEVTAEYFFSRASASWLEPLRRGGVFAAPPSSRRSDDGVERFPVWYPSKFLARLAQSEQDPAVLRAIGEIALELAVTDNPWVRYDVAVVLQHSPSDLTARIVSFADGWLRSSSLLRLPEQIGLLSLRLLEAGRLDEAAALIAALLETVADAKPGPYGEVEVYVRYDAFEFAQFVRSVLPRAGVLGGLPLLRTLCDSLEKAVRLTLAGTDATDDGCAFRPAIEDHRQNRTVLDRTLSLLIEAVRDASDRLTTSDASVLPQLVTELERHEPLVFRRLALYVLRRHPEADRASVARYLLAAKDLERVEVWHERRLLERSGFPHLTTAEQEEFLAPIWSGPEDVATVDLRGEPLPESEIERRRAQWRVHHLIMVADSLSGTQKDEYDRLFAINGEPSHPEFLRYIGEVWTGPTSPRSETELAALDVPEVGGYLASWTPGGEWMSPSREGVGRTLTNVVSQDPQRFLAQWATFKPVHQTYVRAIVQGISDGLRAGKTFSWTEALSLCAWILARPADGAASATDEPIEDQDPDWNATVSAVAWFLRTAMQTRQDAPAPLLPPEHHETVWRLIVELVEWPDANDRGWGGAFDQALNTLHGSSMHTALLFALWRITALRGSTEAAPGGFAMMPEVATLLERHLDPGVDPSRATRALYGHFLSQLTAVDRDWVKDRVGQFFPADEALTSAREATWTTYVEHTQPYSSMLEIVQDELRRSLATLNEKTEYGRERQRLVDALVGHVGGYYWLGEIPLEGGLLDVFYEHADATTRAALVKHIGFSFFHAEAVAAPVVQRVVALWSHRWTASRAHSVADRQTELEPFGWWFASDKFDVDWAIEQLRALLDAGLYPDADFAVAEALAKHVASRPSEVLDLLSRMLPGEDGDYTRVLRCRKEIVSILSSALTQAAPVAQAARDLCNRLVARGHAGFLSLLQ